MLKRTLLVFFVALSVSLDAKPLQIESLEAIDVNGSQQWVLIRTADPTKPVLLYLHGGPGESLIPFVMLWINDRYFLTYLIDTGSDGSNLQQIRIIHRQSPRACRV